MEYVINGKAYKNGDKSHEIVIRAKKGFIID
jgi:hypothetical protein